MATFGAAGGADSGLVGATAAVLRAAWSVGALGVNMAPETSSETTTANQRPRPLANRFLLTHGTLLSSTDVVIAILAVS